MKTILVTGCNGQLGRAINRIYAGTDVQLINTDIVAGSGIKQLDMTSFDNVLDAVKSVKPSIIYNCGAMTNVDGCEKEFETAVKINAIGPKNLAIAASEVGARLVHISTDYVFRGDGENAYTENDKPDPISAYGKSKLMGEEYVKENMDNYYILRTAWLYGEGKNFVRTMLTLSESRKEVSVVDDQIGNPTSAAELAKVVKFLETTDCYGTFHSTCEGSISWAGFAEEIFKVYEKDMIVHHVTSEEYKKMNPASADRPKMSMLDNYMLRTKCDYKMANWRDALMEIKNLGINYIMGR